MVSTHLSPEPVNRWQGQFVGVIRLGVWRQASGLASPGGPTVITRLLAGGRQAGQRDLKMLGCWLER